MLTVSPARKAFQHQRWDKGKDIQATAGSPAGNMRHNPQNYREQSDNAPGHRGSRGWM